MISNVASLETHCILTVMSQKRPEKNGKKRVVEVASWTTAITFYMFSKIFHASKIKDCLTKLFELPRTYLAILLGKQKTTIYKGKIFCSTNFVNSFLSILLKNSTY